MVISAISQQKLYHNTSVARTKSPLTEGSSQTQTVLTNVPADPAHQLAFPQLGDTQTAVPVSSAEEQTAVVWHHQHLIAELHPGRERSAQEPLRSAPQSIVGKIKVRNEKCEWAVA